MTLSGRINLRHGATVTLGCFILFGAASIVAGMRAAIDRGAQREFAYVGPSPELVILPSARPNPDPYAGASVPRR